MSTSDREGLVGRIRQIRRQAAPATAPDAGAGDRERLEALEQRVAHLEQLLQGLQDSVHREASRTDRRMAELETKVDPAAMASALSKDARDRGL